MFEFSIFRIPVRVMPWFWITMGLLAYLINSEDTKDMPVFIINVLLFLILAFVSILLHELGHALTGRRFTRAMPEIVLESFGGFARFQGAVFTKWQNIIMVAAGPMMNFILAGVFFLISLFVLPYIVTDEKGVLIAQFVYLGVVINIFWGLFNLIPVYPMDGGQIMHSLIRNQKKAHQISLIVAIIMIPLSLSTGHLFACFIFGMMAMQNYERMKMHS